MAESLGGDGNCRGLVGNQLLGEPLEQTEVMELAIAVNAIMWFSNVRGCRLAATRLKNQSQRRRESRGREFWQLKP